MAAAVVRGPAFRPRQTGSRSSANGTGRSGLFRFSLLFFPESQDFACLKDAARLTDVASVAGRESAEIKLVFNRLSKKGFSMSELEVESPDDPRLIGTYRPFSVLALVSLVLAVASGIGVISPEFFLLPLIALIVSLVACFRIGAAKVPPVGSSLALLAAFLAGAFLCSGLIYTRLRRDHLFEVARRHAEVWLNLIQDGEIYRPHHLLRDFSRRQPFNADLVKYYQELTNVPNEFDDSTLALSNYESLEPDKSIREFGHGVTFEYQGPTFYRDLVKNECFTLAYLIHWPAESGRPDWPMLLMLQRKEYELPWGIQWSVGDIFPVGETKYFERLRLGTARAE